MPVERHETAPSPTLAYTNLATLYRARGFSGAAIVRPLTTRNMKDSNGPSPMSASRPGLGLERYKLTEFQDETFGPDNRQRDKEASIIALQARIDRARCNGIMDADEASDEDICAGSMINRARQSVREGLSDLRFTLGRGYVPDLSPRKLV